MGERVLGKSTRPVQDDTLIHHKLAIGACRAFLLWCCDLVAIHSIVFECHDDLSRFFTGWTHKPLRPRVGV